MQQWIKYIRKNGILRIEKRKIPEENTGGMKKLRDSKVMDNDEKPSIFSCFVNGYIYQSFIE